MRRPFESNSARRETSKDRLNVVDVEVKHRAWMIKLRALWHRQHQADATTVEKAHLGNREQVLEVERFFVERHRSFQVVHSNGDLPASGLAKVNRARHKRASCCLIREEPRAKRRMRRAY